GTGQDAEDEVHAYVHERRVVTRAHGRVKGGDDARVAGDVEAQGIPRELGRVQARTDQCRRGVERRRAGQTGGLVRGERVVDELPHVRDDRAQVHRAAGARLARDAGLVDERDRHVVEVAALAGVAPERDGEPEALLLV